MPSYYNLPPGNSFEELSDFERLLRNLPLEQSIEALDLLETITRNIVQHSAEEKFRRVRATNEKLAPLFGTPGARDIMLGMGWQVDGEFMVLPKEVKLDFPKHIVKILDAKNYYGKQLRIKKGSAKLGRDPAQAGLLRQLELDRKERAGQAPQANQTPAAAAKDAPEVIHSAPSNQTSASLAQEAAVAEVGTDTPEVLPAAPPGPSPESAHEPKPKGWSCPACTFDNPESNSTCEMCGEPRPAFVTAERNCPEVSTAEISAIQATIPDPKPSAESTSCTPSATGNAQKAAEMPKTAPDFSPPQRAAKPEQKKEMSLQELRALQKNKYNDFKENPDAANSDAYKQPPSSTASQEAGWFDWLWGGSSSSGGSGGGGGGNNKRNGPPPGGPRIKGVGDLPKPIQRGG